MLLFTNAICPLSVGGRDIPPMGAVELATSSIIEHLFSAKGNAHLVLAKPIRQVLPGITSLDVRFLNSDHKLLWHKLLVGSTFYGANIFIDVRVGLLDNSGHALGGNWDDKFTGELEVTALGEPMTDDEMRSVSPGLYIELFRVKQAITTAFGPYRPDTALPIQPVWPLRAGFATELQVELQVRHQIEQAENAAKLLADTPLFCELTLQNEQHQTLSLTAAAGVNDTGKGYCFFQIPAEWCQGTLQFTARLTKQATPTPLMSVYGGGTLFFT